MSNLTEDSYPLLNLQENGPERSQAEQQTQFNQSNSQPGGQPMVVPTQMAPSGTVQQGGFVPTQMAPPGTVQQSGFVPGWFCSNSNGPIRHCSTGWFCSNSNGPTRHCSAEWFCSTQMAPSGTVQQGGFVPTQMAPSGTVQQGGFVHCPPIGAVPYQPAMVPVVMQPMTNEIAPNDYLVMTIILTAICAFFNLLSLMFGIPAVVCAILAYFNKNRRNYTSTRSLGISAVILNTLNVVYTLVISVFIFGYSMYVLGVISA